MSAAAPHRRATPRRAFTLIEAVVAIVVLAIAVPTGLALVGDASRARADQVRTTRALWLATAVSEQILADLASPDERFGSAIIDDPDAYLSGDTNPIARLGDVAAAATDAGLSVDIAFGPRIDAAGAATGDDGRDLYRTLTVTVRWTDHTGEPRSMPIETLATDTTP